MAYGTIKVDTITFTDAGVDKSVTISGLVQNPTFSGNITVTGTVSGNTIQGQTVSGVTVTGTTANFASGVFTTQISGATVTGNVGSFTTITGGTVTLTSGVFGAGSAAAPSIAFTGDTNTGIYSPGADQVAISTNGTGRLFVDSAGYVTIGTTDNPAAAQLMVTKAGGAQGFEFLPGSATTVNTVLHYNRAGSAYLTSTVNALDHIWQTGGSERLRITSAGLVGIGTSTWDLNSVTTKMGVKLSGTTGDGISLLSLQNTANQYVAVGAQYDNTNTNNGSQIRFGIDNEGDAYSMIAFATANAGTPSEKMRLDRLGRLGIGTTSPSSGLHLANATAGSAANFTLSNPANNWSIRTGTTDNALVFVENQFASEKARIDSSGRLLVGTSSDSGGALLQVNGNRIRVATAKTPASAADTGTAGEICWDADYIYVCTATNTWKRTAISTW